MKIVIVGLGKVGMTLASELRAEGNDITVIDRPGLSLPLRSPHL